jgi:hypothetical protein
MAVKSFITLAPGEEYLDLDVTEVVPSEKYFFFYLINIIVDNIPKKI